MDQFQHKLNNNDTMKTRLKYITAFLQECDAEDKSDNKIHIKKETLTRYYFFKNHENLVALTKSCRSIEVVSPFHL